MTNLNSKNFCCHSLQVKRHLPWYDSTMSDELVSTKIPKLVIPRLAVKLTATDFNLGGKLRSSDHSSKANHQVSLPEFRTFSLSEILDALTLALCKELETILEMYLFPNLTVIHTDLIALTR